MNRNEAVLRELNLYPLWVRRETFAPEIALPAVTLEALAADLATAPVAESFVAHAVESVVAPVVELAASVAPDVSELSAPVSEFVAPAEFNAVPEADVVPHTETAEDLFGMSFRDESPDPEEDTLREFQLKNAAGAFGHLTMGDLAEKAAECALCGLSATRTQTVFGAGAETADWMFIGEAPGEEEDLSGAPFAGISGRLFGNMLLAMRLKRSDVYIANVLKCRPPEDRHPHVGEVQSCVPYLKRQISLVQPKLIVALGKTAASALLETDATIGSLRGMVHDYKGIPLVVTFHPAYLLRSPMEKARAWQDLCLAGKTMQGLIV